MAESRGRHLVNRCLNGQMLLYVGVTLVLGPLLFSFFINDLLKMAILFQI